MSADPERAQIRDEASGILGNLVGIGVGIDAFIKTLPAPSDEMANGSQPLDWTSNLHGALETSLESLAESETFLRRALTTTDQVLLRQHERVEQLCSLSERYSPFAESGDPLPTAEQVALQWQTRYRVVLQRSEDHHDVPDVAFESPAQLAQFLGPILCNEPREILVSMALDISNRIIGWKECFAGTLRGTFADPRLIVQGALLLNAQGIVVAHNHPGSCLEPSVEDLEFTKRLAQAASLFGIKLIDHLILGESSEEWTSLRQRRAW